MFRKTQDLFNFRFSIFSQGVNTFAVSTQLNVLPGVSSIRTDWFPLMGIASVSASVYSISASLLTDSEIQK